MLCVQNTDKQNTDNSIVMLCVQNTDKQNIDNSHRHVLCVEYKQNTNNSHRHVLCVEYKQNTNNSHRHVLCVGFRQTKHRQFSPSCGVYRTQTILTVMLCVQNTSTTQTILTVMLCVQNTNRTQTILTVILCAQNTVGRWRGHVHQRCRRLRVVTVAPAQSAVPAQSVTLLPVGQSVLTHHVFSGTRMDRRWHSDGQHTTRQQQTEESVQSFYCLHRLWTVLSVLPSSFLSSLFPLSFLLLGSVCLWTLSFFSILPSSFLLSFPFQRVLNSRERSWLARCSRARYDLHSKETTANKQPYNYWLLSQRPLLMTVTKATVNDCHKDHYSWWSQRPLLITVTKTTINYCHQDNY